MDRRRGAELLIPHRPGAALLCLGWSVVRKVSVIRRGSKNFVYRLLFVLGFGIGFGMGMGMGMGIVRGVVVGAGTGRRFGRLSCSRFGRLRRAAPEPAGRYPCPAVSSAGAASLLASASRRAAGCGVSPPAPGAARAPRFF